MKYNKKWFISMYVYLMFMWVSIIVTSIITWTLLANYFWNEIINKTKSYYASESWVEEWLLAYKKDPNIDNFVPNEDIIQERQNKRVTQYKDQKIYKRELVIKETIPAWKSIQLPFRKKDLDSRITKFHIAVLQHKTKTPPLSQADCDTPVYDSSLEISAYQKAIITNNNPITYNVELNSNWNWCYIWNNSVWKSSLITYSDPYSNQKISLVWDKCIMNSKWNVVWAVFEKTIPYVFDDKWDSIVSNNSCEYNCSWWACSKYYTYDTNINKSIKSYLKFYTISSNFIYWDMSDTGLIMFNLRAINEDTQIAMWATDDLWNPYEIPWRYVSFSALWIAQWWDIHEWLFTRLKIKKKANNDLLPIFDYSIFSESELVK